ncbi:MAG: peptidase M23, partial [Pseudomonadota bacterium]
MNTTTWGLIAISTLALAACDIVRVPGDGREAPDPPPIVPDGAPGPAPPTVPVTDPWGDGEGPTETPINDGDLGDDTADPLDGVEPVEDTGAADPIDPPLDDPEPGSEAIAPVEDTSDPDPEPLPVKFEYYAPGDLLPGSGFGRADETIYAPNMVFPIKSAPTYLNSQVYRPGGGVGGDQCDISNFSMPWRDNFCETRTSNRTTPLCSLDKVHQGQDLRTGTATECLEMRAQSPRERGLHEAVAVEDGIIQYIGS